MATRMSAFPDAVATAAAIRRRDLSPVELVADTFARIAEIDATVNSFTVLFEDDAREAARAAERRVLTGEPLGPLHGVPVSIKDVVWVEGKPATNGCIAFADFLAPEDAVAVERLRAAGAIVVGKTNNPELCLAAYSDNDIYGATRNPWDLTRTAGGSSGGAGASVACGLAPIAIGTDFGGSIRIPASFCGVAGLKPTFGLVPTTPGFPGWRTIGVFGPLARSTRDVALALEILAGPHPSDELSAPRPRVDYAAAADRREIAGTVAFSVDFGFAPVDAAVRAAFERAIDDLDAAGWKLEEARPDAPDASDIWSLIAACEGYADYDGLLAADEPPLEPRTRKILERGARASSRDYLRALGVRAEQTREWLRFFERFDLLLTPTTQMTAFPLGTAGPAEIDGRPIGEVLQPNGSARRPESGYSLCLPVNLAGLPAASVPCGFDDGGLPIGLQIVGPRFADDVVLSAAAAWEEIRPWNDKAPEVAV